MSLTFRRDDADHETEGDQGHSVTEQEHVKQRDVAVGQNGSVVRVELDPEEDGVDGKGDGQVEEGGEEPGGPVGGGFEPHQFHGLLQSQADSWDREATQSWDIETTECWDRETTECWDSDTTECWDSETTERPDSETTECCDSETTVLVQ